MVEKNEWPFYQEIDWNDPKFNVFSIDTRDFHCGYRQEKDHPDWLVLKKYPHFFLSEEELKKMLDRYFIESGGKKKWRFFSLEANDNWRLKYLRIWRTPLGFIVCDSYNAALKNNILELAVLQDYLNAY